MTRICILMTAAMMTFTMPNIDVETGSAGVCIANQYQDDHAVIMADQIQLRYRVVDGVLQYRRFNTSRNCWVDPDWINV